jgi:Protein of unknown function (DUF642)
MPFGREDSLEDHMTRRIHMSFSIPIVFLLAIGANAANLIKNGSFETPLVPVGSYETFSTGQTFSGWKVVGAAGNVAIVSGQLTQNGFSFPAEAGKQWLDLTGLSNTRTGVAQTFASTPGRAYTLTFWVGNVYDPQGIFGVSSTVIVRVNGKQVYKATNSRGKGKTTQVWEKFVTTITATSSKTTIAFINDDPSNDTENGLDAITVVPLND